MTTDSKTEARYKRIDKYIEKAPLDVLLYYQTKIALELYVRTEHGALVEHRKQLKKMNKGQVRG